MNKQFDLFENYIPESIAGNTEPTMSSLEIAELTGKEHRNVTRDIDAQLSQLEGGVLRFEHTHRNPQNGQKYKIYRLPKRECLILISGYSVELRAKIIDRWTELEKKQNKPQAPNLEGPLLLAHAVLAADKMIREKDAIIAELTPKAEFAEIVTGSETKLYSFREAVKVLGSKKIGEKLLFDFCRKKGYLMSNSEPYQEYVSRGYFRQVLLQYRTALGEPKTYAKTVITGKGLEVLSKALQQGGYLG